MNQLNLFDFTPQNSDGDDKTTNKTIEAKIENKQLENIYSSTNTYKPTFAPPAIKYLKEWQPKDINQLDTTNPKPQNHGWLLPLLYRIDSLTNQRWQHWAKANQVLEKDLIYYCGHGLDNQFFQNALFVHTYPVLSFEENPKVSKYFWSIFDLIQKKKGMSLLPALEYFIDWMLHGLGHELFKDRNNQHNIDPNLDWLLYQYVDVSIIMAYPFDYFGLICPEIFSDKSNSELGYFPTPTSLSQMMIRLFFKENQITSATHSEPSAGTGTVPLLLSNHIFCSDTIELQDTLTRCQLINFYFWCPCFIRPLWYLIGRNSICTGNTLQMKMQIDYLQDYKKAIVESMETLPIFK